MLKGPKQALFVAPGAPSVAPGAYRPYTFGLGQHGMTHQGARRVAVAVLDSGALSALASAVRAQSGPATPNELVRRFQAAMAAHDIEGLANLYAEQGLILPPSGGAVTGRVNIRALLARNLAAGQPALRMLNARFDGTTEVP